jgi:LysR family transcriptional activator of dmlA
MRVFVKVAEVSSFTHAADKLDISPAMATRAVAALETRLGVRLLQRTTRRVSLTESGEVFLERARSIVADLDDAENMVAAQQRAPGGILRIAAPVAFGLRHLSPLLKSFAERYPLVVPHITLSNDPVNLVERRFDVAVIPDGDHYSTTLVMRRFTTSPLCLVAAPDYLARCGTPLTLSELEHHVFLAHSGDGLTAPQRFLEPIKDALRRVEKQIVANNLEMIYRFTLEGFGVAALPDYLVHREIEAGELVQLLRTVDLPSLNLNIAYASRKNLATKVRAFVDFTLEYFGNVGIENRLPRATAAVRPACPRGSMALPKATTVPV